ncbi:tetratricopeptide repeat protein [Laspinema sp. A4]|uniref:tetratricopeptide repeat protein n=1 Tax=Laspinema sp. D2d TaxID=2953686 RepID=UPI0021BA7B2B|nr:tetratricopeptide repeat protein [Laspinema sp. D2d]MCT7983341.1 tetratricopeptide repeat protein [Laspinema sp. D2d]
MDLLTERQTRLLTAGALVVGGTVCGGPLGTIAASVAAGIVANDIVPQHLNHIAVRLRGSGEKLANHDLTEATGFAIALIIKSLAEAGTYPNSTKKLETLAKYTLEAWQQVADNLKQVKDPHLAPLQETSITALFQGGTTDYVGQTVLEKEDWQDLLNSWLCPGANVKLPDGVVPKLATELRNKFALALREVLKADFENGGKAFAGLTLSLLGEMRGILQKLREESSHAQAEDLTAKLAVVTQLQQELEENSQRFQVLGRQIKSGFEAVLQELGVTRVEIAEMRSELQKELWSLAEAIRETHKRLSDYFTGKKPDLQAISFSLDTNPPKVTNWQGREAELTTVNRWLDDENTKLGVIVGIGGMGKSTLAAKVFWERTDFEDKLWLDLGRRPLYSIVARGILQQLGKLSPQQLEQIEETRLTDGLVHCLQRRRFLLVLDNLESVLQDEGYKDFLQRWVGDCHHTEILVTTQIPPNLVQDKPTELPLPGLSAEEGARLLRDLGLGGTAEELEGFVDQVNGHPLTLRLVAGLLYGEFGDGATLADLTELGSADVGALMSRLQGYHRRELVQLVAVLDASFNRLPETWRKVLLSLVVFRQAFNAEVASAMVGEAVAEKELRGLAKRGFLVAEAGGYTFQPLILDYLKFRVGDLPEGHLRAIEFYQSRFKSRPEWQTVEDVREYLEVFYHRCELGEYEAAFYVIRDGSYSDNCVDRFLALRGNNQLLAELYQQLRNHLPNRQDLRYLASLTSLGSAYHALGRYTEAIYSNKQALEIFRQIGDRRGEAISLNNLGNAYHSLRRYTKAITFHEQSLEIQRQIGHRGGEATSLNNLGSAYHSLGLYTEAITFHEQSLKIYRQIGDRQGEASSLGNLGNTYHSLGGYTEAISFYEQSLEIFRQIGDIQGEASSLGNLGNTYHSLGGYTEAIGFYEQSLEIDRQIGDIQGEASSLNNLGSVYHSLGRYTEAIGFYEQSLKIYRQIGDRRGEAIALNNLGSTDYSLGRYTEAISFHEQSLKIYRQIGDRRGEATSLNGLGTPYNSLGRYTETLGFYEQSLKIYRQIGDRRGEATSLNGLGSTYHSLGRYTEAISFHEQSLKIYLQIGDRQGEANSLNCLGSPYNSLGRYIEAITVYKPSLEIYRQIGDREGEANSLNGLGSPYNSLGRYTEAITVYKQSLEIAREIGHRGGEAASLNNLGSSYNSLGRYTEAITVYKQSLEIFREIGHKRGKAASLMGLGAAYNSLGRDTEAITVYKQSLEIQRQIGDRRGEANSLIGLGGLYQKIGRIREGCAASQQGMLIYQELNLSLDAYPIPNWMKRIAKFAQRGNFHLVVCFIGGFVAFPLFIVAFPFALIGFILLILYRLIRQRFNRR